MTSTMPVLLSLLVSFGLTVLGAAHTTPQSVKALLAAKGGQEAVRLLFEDDNAWDSLLKGVASGRREWLLVAQELSPFTDAHASETLGMAVEEALVEAPSLTLEIFGSGACTGVGFADQEAESLQQVLREISKRRKALASVSQPRLAAAKKECLALLQETEKSAPSWNWVGKE